MKKFIAILCLTLAIVTLLAGCGKFECDSCGREVSGKKYKHKVAGESVTVCEDCHSILEAAESLGNLLS